MLTLTRAEGDSFALLVLCLSVKRKQDAERADLWLTITRAEGESFG